MIGHEQDSLHLFKAMRMPDTARDFGFIEEDNFRRENGEKAIGRQRTMMLCRPI